MAGSAGRLHQLGRRRLSPVLSGQMGPHRVTGWRQRLLASLGLLGLATSPEAWACVCERVGFFAVAEDAKVDLSCTYLQQYVRENPLPEYVQRIIEPKSLKQELENALASL